MTDPKKQRKLKNYLILPGFQGRILLFIVLAGFVCAGLNAYLYYNYVVDSYDFILKYSSLPQQLVDDRYRDLRNFGLALGLATLVIMLIIATWAMVLTHRAAGAVYHMKRVMDEIRSGNLTQRVHLRPKDEFQDIAQSFNRMMDELHRDKTGG
jgi:nitrogen fixation/metabolism regulation signal transduction histidine kinase